jgi:hypothetical protein
MYQPNPKSQYRVKFAFKVEFTNGGFLQGKDFFLDLEGDTVSEQELKTMIVESMNLARAGQITIYEQKVVQRKDEEVAA